MKKIYLSISIAFYTVAAFAQTQSFCNPNGNVVIYSNYDGGPLTINVDQNIPNLKIGIVSYEFARINIIGTYAGNVTEVRWAGYNGSNNHCALSTPYTTTITGVPNNVDTIITIPTATFSNTNGYNFIICNYSCDDSTNQGGCNTPDQIVHYFITNFGGVLYYHHTQYGCWSGTYNVSGGGNCCISPFTTSITENETTPLEISPNPSSGIFHVAIPETFSNGKLHVMNALGEEVRVLNIENNLPFVEFSLDGEARGIYFVRLESEDAIYNSRIIFAE